MESEKILDANDAAEYLRISISLLRRLCSEKQIPMHKIGARVLFFASELNQWLRNDGEMPDGKKKVVGVRRVKKVYGRRQ